MECKPYCNNYHLIIITLEPTRTLPVWQYLMSVCYFIDIHATNASLRRWGKYLCQWGKVDLLLGRQGRLSRCRDSRAGPLYAVLGGPSNGGAEAALLSDGLYL